MLTFEDDAARTANRPKGLPRPLADQNGTLRPVPWTQEEPWYAGEPTPWSVIDPLAASQAQKQSLCLVCGEHVTEGAVLASVADIPKNGRPRLIRRRALKRIYVIDGGPLHAQCLLLTRSHCMAIRNGLKAGDYKTIAYRD